MEHRPKSEFDWECPERLLSIVDLLVRPRIFEDHELEMTTDFSAVNTESLMRVHTGPYIKFVDSLGKKLEVSWVVWGGWFVVVAVGLVGKSRSSLA